MRGKGRKMRSKLQFEFLNTYCIAFCKCNAWIDLSVVKARSCPAAHYPLNSLIDIDLLYKNLGVSRVEK